MRVRDGISTEDAWAIAELDTLLFDNGFGPSTARREFEASEVVVATDRDGLAGYAIVRRGRVNDLLRLGVRPSAQGCGLGRLLLERVLERVEGDVMLTVLKGNARALRLYRSTGFAIEGEVEGYWLMVNRRR